MGESQPPFIHKGIEVRQQRIRTLRDRIDVVYRRANSRTMDIDARVREELLKLVNHQNIDFLSKLEAERFELDGMLKSLDDLEAEVDRKAAELLDTWLALDARIQASLGGEE